VFSFIGYKSSEVNVNNRSVIDMTLTEEASSLKEVIINAGYWQVKDVERTGNIVRLDAKDIQKQPVQNPLAAMQGRLAGVDIVQQTGIPGSNFQVRIRGTNSIANGNEPLYIIDGVPYTSTTMSLPETSNQIYGLGSSPLNTINPADIESIEVLKDADATAIYGSRGSNGVILISTKKGKAGKTKIDFNVYSGVGKVTRSLNLLTSQQYLQMRHEAFANDNVTPTLANAVDLLTWDTTRYTDWQQTLIGGTAHTTDAQLSLSGGDASTLFSIGTGYHRETTVFPGENADQRFSVLASINNSAFNQKLKTSFSLNYTISNTNLLSQDLTPRALSLPPIAPPLYDDQGELSWTHWTSSFENPMAYTQRIYESSTNNLIGTTTINYSILPNLITRISLGYTNIVMNAITTNPISAQAPAPPVRQNSSSFSASSFSNWIIEPQLNWRPTLGKGQFDVLIGTTFLDQTTEGSSQTGYGYSSEALMKNLSAAPNRTSGTNFYNQYRYQAVFGRLNYSWKGTYIINLTGRRDGSSRFGPGNQFANFGAIGAAWIFTQLPAFTNTLSFLSYGKLRASAGITGNDQLGNYQFLDTYSSSAGPYQGTIGLQPDRLSNPDFAWETNEKIEAGLELGFWENRILSSVSFYQNRSSNQLVGYPLPATTGFTSIQGNFPATVQNKGLEIELTTLNIEQADFSWSTAINFTRPRNELIDFPNLQNFPAYANTYVVGQPLNIRKLYNNTGIDPISGLYSFEDVNQDGFYTISDKKIIRFLGQDYYGGLQNNLQYKGITLDFLFQFVKQTGYSYLQTFNAPPGTMTNFPTFITTEHWTPGDDATIQRYSVSTQGAAANALYINSQYYEADASFIRLKNISLSYSLPAKWLQKIRMQSIRTYLQGQNLATFTRYKGLDPETQLNNLPPLRVLTIGIQITL
ncbi:MAG: SusC/RagA family TonB-linked outer membrane protein, partial [Cyclobacteriaceae bacterium]